MTVSVVLVSAGKGTRLGASVPKAVVSVAGKTLLELSLMHISEFKPDQLIVELVAQQREEVPARVRRLAVSRLLFSLHRRFFERQHLFSL